MVKLNNWGTKQLIWIAAAFPLIMLVLVGLAAIGFDIPVLRQVIGFILLTLIPGFLILRILKLHNLGAIETLLYSVGLSISFVMFFGFSMNMILPLIGIPNPISTYPVIISISVATLVLCLIAYKQESSVKGHQFLNNSIHWPELLSPPALLLLLLPILTILGTQLVYLQQGNIVILILLLLIAAIAVLVAFNKFIPSKLYPLAIMAISISLLWHLSLISTQLTGGDIFYEYLVQKASLDNSIWDINKSGILNGMLSITILPPVYSLTLNLETVWIYKVIYPMFYCLVPLALFQVFRKQMDKRVAFFAVFFFMSFSTFVTQINRPRMEVAELFFVLSMLLLFYKGMNTSKRVALLLIFGFALVVSHYATAYIFLAYLLLVLPLLFLQRNEEVCRIWEGLTKRLTKFRSSEGITQQLPKPVGDPLPWSKLSVTYVVLFFVSSIGWYMFVSSGSPFNALVNIGDHIASSLTTEFLSFGATDPQIAQAFGLIQMRGGEIEWEIARIFQYITQFFIVTGIIWLIANWGRTRFHPEYAALGLVSMVILAMAVFLPYFSRHMHMFRLYHTTLLFLAPFCIFGGIVLFHWLFRILSLSRLRRISMSAYLRMAVLLVLVPYFLFTSGFIFEMSGATATSLPLSLYKEDWRLYTNPDIHACQWLIDTAGSGYTVYTDAFGDSLFIANGVFPKVGLPEQLSQDEYIFLRYWNIEYGLFLETGGQQGVTRGGHIDLQSEENLAILTNKS